MSAERGGSRCVIFHRCGGGTEFRYGLRLGVSREQALSQNPVRASLTVMVEQSETEQRRWHQNMETSLESEAE